MKACSAAFEARVGGLARRHHLGRERRDVDDRAGARHQHVRQRGQRRPHTGEKVHVHHPLDLVGREVPDLLVLRDGRVVHQHVDPAMPRDGVVDHALGEGAHAEVAGEIAAPGRARAAGLDQPLQVLLAPRHRHHAGAARGEGFGRDPADPRGGPGDDHHAVAKIHQGFARRRAGSRGPRPEPTRSIAPRPSAAGGSARKNCAASAACSPRPRAR